MAKSKDALSSEITPFPRRPIVILGAGVIGCATALQLLQNGFRVILVAEFHPGDRDILYASAWAGAAWHAGGGLTDEHKYLQAVSHRQLLKLAREEPESGVCIVDSLEYVEEEPPANSALWGKTVLKNVGTLTAAQRWMLIVPCHKFRTLKPGEYPSNFNTAWAYESLVIDPTLHMPWLGKKITSLGGVFVRQKLSSLGELYAMFPESRIFINASGWGSRDLTDVRDDNSYPDRGQNVFLKSHQKTMYFRNGQEYTYIIPRPMSHGVIIGGVKQGENFSPDVDMDIARDEIQRAHRLAPEVVPADPPESDLSYIVGIRPGRKGGFRLDSQKIGDRLVLSAYGFGGGGYAFSYGVGHHLLRWVEQAEFDNVVGL